MIRALYAIAAAFILSAGMVAGAAATLDAVSCRTEDSSNCVWIAPLSGNGHGVSFVTIGNTTFYFNGTVHDWSDK
jgi:hypothetical protein